MRKNDTFLSTELQNIQTNNTLKDLEESMFGNLTKKIYHRYRDIRIYSSYQDISDNICRINAIFGLHLFFNGAYQSVILIHDGNKISVKEILFDDSLGFEDSYEWYSSISLSQTTLTTLENKSAFSKHKFNGIIGFPIVYEDKSFYCFFNDNWERRSPDGYNLPNLPERLHKIYHGQPYKSIRHY